ncbi:alpha-glycosidase [Paenibacillus sp. YYML68]|uniref:alpha-glycosidase n=1 Tax=Paenibacillus sp. YYML68 TaxID=2909250 RepID=UPI0024937AE7|nr:alpha-glycosidase [Paenibacillus sp. YYML68]
MVLEAIYHRPKLNWSYAYDNDTIHIRIRTKKDNVQRVRVLAGDKYMWEASVGYVDMRKLPGDALFDYWQAEVRPPYRRLRYGFCLEHGDEQVWMTEQGFFTEEPKDSAYMFEYPFLNPADVFAPPAWVKEAVFYQIFPERFANGDPDNDPVNALPWGSAEPTPTNYFGGDLQGIIDHLDYLQQLGVNAIYFNPLFEATTNHKYDTKDYMKVDPQFGTNETLKELVDLCHARGIRVLLDAVFNHSGHTFEPFLDVLKHGAASRYADWFHVREFPLEVKDGVPTYDTFAFEPIMPKLNTENSEVQAYLLEVAEYWIRDIGIDGWRLDVANEVDHRFWRLFRDRVKALKPDAYILGEIWHDSMMWLQGDQFDAVMNYPFTEAVLSFTARGRLDAAGFAHAVGAQLASYPQQVNEVAFNLLGSHDTPRLLTLCGGSKPLMKLATVLQFVFPGTPCIYYGDEIGMDGAGDPDCRKCMVWDEEQQDRELFAYFQRVIAMRKQLAPLREGSVRFLLARADSRQLVLERATEDGRVLVAVNASDREASVQVNCGEGSWTDFFTGAVHVTPLSGQLQLSLPAFGFAVLNGE